jgi:hypothetical protein
MTRRLRPLQDTLKRLYGRAEVIAFDAHPFFAMVPKSKSFTRRA